MHIRNNALFLALLIALCEHPCLVHAQNTFTPDPIQHYYPSFWNDDVFAERVPAFALGHQWGAAKLDKVNTAKRRTSLRQSSRSFSRSFSRSTERGASHEISRVASHAVSREARSAELLMKFLTQLLAKREARSAYSRVPM